MEDRAGPLRHFSWTVPHHPILEREQTDYCSEFCLIGIDLNFTGMNMQKTLDVKIARILADRSCEDFILADAKDADMAYGLAAPGLSPEAHGKEAKFRTLDQYRTQIREVIAQGLVDIVFLKIRRSRRRSARMMRQTFGLRGLRGFTLRRRLAHFVPRRWTMPCAGKGPVGRRNGN